MYLTQTIRATLLTAIGYFVFFVSPYAHAETYSSYSITGTAGVGSLEMQGHAAFRQIYGLKLGYDLAGEGLADSAGIEAVYNYLYGKGGEGFLVRMDYLFPFSPRGRLVPFAAAGAGGIATHGDTGLVFSLGGGAKYLLNDRLALRGDLRDSLVNLRGAGFNNMEFTVGVSYLFGKRLELAPATVQPPAVAPARRQYPGAGEPDELDDPSEPQKMAAPEDSILASAPLPDNGVPEGSGTPLAGPEPPVPGPAQAPSLARPTATTEPVSLAAPAVSPVPAAPTAPLFSMVSAVTNAPSANSRETLACSGDASAPCGNAHKAKGTGAHPVNSQRKEEFPSAQPDRDDPSLGLVSGLKTAISVRFRNGEFAVPAEDYSRLKRLAQLVNSDPELRIVIAGNTDDLGGAHQNFVLSRKRARSVREYLMKVLKVEGWRVAAKAFGASLPLSDKNTVEERDRRRRAVVIVFAMHGKQ